jgi:hypothetical protein
VSGKSLLKANVTYYITIERVVQEELAEIRRGRRDTTGRIH